MAFPHGNSLHEVLVFFFSFFSFYDGSEKQSNVAENKKLYNLF